MTVDSPANGIHKLKQLPPIMKLTSALELKHRLVTRTLRRIWTARTVAEVAMRSRRIAAREDGRAQARPRGLALGVAAGRGKGDYRLAIRVQDPEWLDSPLLEHIRREARGEVELRYTGAIHALAARRTGHWYRRRIRPLEIGISVAHKNVTAGTIGAFVRRGRSKDWFILSNNHVLADVNAGRPGDEILQPGPADGGRLRKEDIVARLAKFERISFSDPNLVDCAIARVVDGMEVVSGSIHGIGDLKGVREDDVELGMVVRKLGRTTGLKKGRVTAVALDDVAVDMGTGIASFDNQIEIESAETRAFCRGGDSGSLIVDADDRAAALLFAGADHGGTGNLGLTYANPIEAVIQALEVRF